MSLFDPADLEPTAPLGPSIRVRMLIAYQGGPFRGFAANHAVRTVAGDLSEGLRRITGHSVHLTCAGRTDAGVHAWGQVVHFDLPGDGALDLVGWQRSLNKMLAPAVVVRAVTEAPLGFDARRSAIGRRYRFTVVNRVVPDPFLAATSWLVRDELDLRAMQLACDPFIGTHDFSSFCRRPPDKTPEDPLVRIVRDARWQDLGEGVLRFDMEANAFCHQMVRSVVGSMVAVGRGQMRAGDMAWIIRSKDRSLAAKPAPSHGLCLWEVLYPGAQSWPAVADGPSNGARRGAAV